MDGGPEAVGRWVFSHRLSYSWCSLASRVRLIFQPGVSVTISEPQRVVSFSLELAALVFSVLSLRFYFSMSYV